MQKVKSEVKNKIKLLGLIGPFPDPDFDMLLTITLTGCKIIRRSQITLDRATTGRISHNDLGKLTGELSFTKT